MRRLFQSCRFWPNGIEMEDSGLRHTYTANFIIALHAVPQARDLVPIVEERACTIAAEPAAYLQDTWNTQHASFNNHCISDTQELPSSTRLHAAVNRQAISVNGLSSWDRFHQGMRKF